MIDMHNHILPAIDDGPQSIDGTLNYYDRQNNKA